MRVFHLVLGASFLTLSAGAGTAPPEYWHMTSAEKRDFHVSQGLKFPHRFGQPGTIRQVCTQGMAVMGMVSKAYMTRTIEDRSGYPDDWWRYFFGKAVHTFGPMAPGEITINKPIFDIEPGTYAVTLRYSLANAYLPRVPGADFRPGLVVIIHRDGDKEDRGLFTMPPSGLTGFPKPVNPFSISFVNHLEGPGTSTQRLAAATFGRVVTNVYRQVVSPGFGSVLLKPIGPWQTRYDDAPGYQFGERLAAMQWTDGGEPMFDIYGYDGKAATVEVGSISLLGPFVQSRHANAWFVPHYGFEAK